MAEEKSKNKAKGVGSSRERILDVAEDIFACYGYLAARVNDISEAAGIRRPSLFHHFPNKQGLYIAVMNRAIQYEEDHFRENISTGDDTNPEESLEQLVDSTFNFLVDNPNFCYLSLYTLAGNRNEEVPTELSPVSMDWWERILKNGRDAGVFRDVSVAECMALIGGMTTFYVAMPRSKTQNLNTIGEVERERFRTELQRLVRALVMADEEVG